MPSHSTELTHKASEMNQQVSTQSSIIYINNSAHPHGSVYLTLDLHFKNLYDSMSGRLSSYYPLIFTRFSSVTWISAPN